MSKEKQIEEMARIICKPTSNRGNCDKCGFKKQCSKFDDATNLYNAGYRKLDDVKKRLAEGVESFLTDDETELIISEGEIFVPISAMRKIVAELEGDR